jgi:hypothetical protein
MDVVVLLQVALFMGRIAHHYYRQTSRRPLAKKQRVPGRGSRKRLKHASALRSPPKVPSRQMFPGEHGPWLRRRAYELARACHSSLGWSAKRKH